MRAILRGGNHHKWVVAGGLGRNHVLSHVAKDMVFFWFWAVGGQCAQLLVLLGPFLGLFGGGLWTYYGVRGP